MDLNYFLTSNGLSIKDSYKIKSKKQMQSILTYIRTMAVTSSYDILKRTDANLINEWRAHNLLYNLHFMRSHTADVDFEYPQKWYYKVIYWTLSKLYF